jgi:hypothetical protein
VCCAAPLLLPAQQRYRALLARVYTSFTTPNCAGASHPPPKKKHFGCGRAVSPSVRKMTSAAALAHALALIFSFPPATRQKERKNSLLVIIINVF